MVAERGSTKMGTEDKNAGPEWRWRREGPKFNEIYSEYKGWKGQVEY